jgi:hypothetical protein
MLVPLPEARFPVHESEAALKRHVFAKGAAWQLQVHAPFRQTQENFARNLSSDRKRLTISTYAGSKRMKPRSKGARIF